MICSAKIRYGLRVLVYLGSKSSGSTTQLKEISSSEDISIKYLEQIMNQLKSAKFVSVTRGAKGGYQLCVDPKAVSLKDIYRAFVGTSDEDELADLSSEHSTSCVTSKVWPGMTSAINDYLESIILSDLIEEYISKNQSMMYYI